MSLESPIYFIEPELGSKRKGVVKKRLGKSKVNTNEPDLGEQLITLRKRAVKNTQKNFKKFNKYADETKDIKLHVATSPDKIVKYISNQTKDLGLTRIDTNRSNTIRPLEPYLIQHGFDVVHTYNHAIKSGSIGRFKNTEPGNYWNLGQLELENKFQSFNHNPKPMSYTRKMINRSTNRNDFIGLVGANVFSATGEVFTVQHLYNITSILTHAKRAFLVLTLDKLVDNYSDALFQARCTAMYGLEQIILDLFDVERLRGRLEEDGKLKKGTEGKKRKKSTWGTKFNDEDVFEKYKPPEDLHVIILDDRRINMIGTKDEDLLYCIGCRKCGLLCPRVRVGRQKAMELQDITEVAFSLTARELLLDGFLYDPEFVIDEGLFDCSLCRSCSNICPVNIDLAEKLQGLREKCQKDDVFAKPHKRIRNNILEVGNAYGEDHTYKANVKAGGQK